MATTLHVTRTGRAAPAGLTVTDVLLLLMALLWGVNFIVAKYGTRVFAPLAFNCARVALAALVLWAIVAARGSALPKRRELLRMAALGVLGNGLYQVLFVEGLARTRASDTALVLAASPAFMAIIGRLRGLERTGWRGVAGIALSLAGIALVVFGSRHDPSGASTMLGYALTIAACLCWSMYSVLLKPFTERHDGVTLSAVTMTGGLIPLVAVGAPSLVATRWDAVGASAWAAVAYSGLGALVVAYLFWYRGVRVLGPTRASMYANTQPLFALGAAWAFLGETPRLLQLAGAAAIMAGLLLTRLTSTTPCTGE